MLIDIGAYRDMHRHRRCHQTRQAFTWKHGFSTPAAIEEAGLGTAYRAALEAAQAAAAALPEVASHYLLPFAARGRFLFQMDFAEAEYISKLRSGVKGHFSYRDVAWRMKTEMERVEPELGRLIEATPPWIEDPLVR
jgi:thymidylate synthase ThyX